MPDPAPSPKTEAPEQIVVYLEEEYGFRQWVWYSGMTAEELVAWWTETESMLAYFFSPAGLPGKMVEVWLEDDGMWPVEEDAEGYPAKVEGAEVIPYPQGWDSYANPDPRPRTYWKAHTHMDEDSYLQGPDGTYYHHKGYPPKE